MVVSSYPASPRANHASNNRGGRSVHSNIAAVRRTGQTFSATEPTSRSFIHPVEQGQSLMSASWYSRRIRPSATVCVPSPTQGCGYEVFAVRITSCALRVAAHERLRSASILPSSDRMNGLVD